MGQAAPSLSCPAKVATAADLTVKRAAHFYITTGTTDFVAKSSFLSANGPATAEAGEPGAIGKLLRREGLYSSHLALWRQAARDGSLAALSQKRGPKSRPAGEKRLARALAKAERENARLRDDLRKAHLVIDVQGKVAGLLGLSFDGEKT